MQHKAAVGRSDTHHPHSGLGQIHTHSGTYTPTRANTHSPGLRQIHTPLRTQADTHSPGLGQIHTHSGTYTPTRADTHLDSGRYTPTQTRANTHPLGQIHTHRDAGRRSLRRRPTASAAPRRPQPLTPSTHTGDPSFTGTDRRLRSHTRAHAPADPRPPHTHTHRHARGRKVRSRTLSRGPTASEAPGAPTAGPRGHSPLSPQGPHPRLGRLAQPQIPRYLSRPCRCVPL